MPKNRGGVHANIEKKKKKKKEHQLLNVIWKKER